MSSFTKFSFYYLLLVNLFLVSAQQPNASLGQQQLQQTLNVHQPTQQTQHQEIKSTITNPNNEHVGSNNVNTKNQGSEAHQAGPIVGLFSSSYRGPSKTSSSNNSPANPTGGQFVSTQHGFTTFPGYPQDPVAYSTNNAVGHPSNSFQPPQLFGLSSNGDFQLSAYFGNIIWTVLSGLVILIAVVVLFRSFGVFEKIGGLFDNFNDSDGKNGSGRAIDLDKLSTMVYTAFDQYGKWKNIAKDKKAF